MSQDGISPRTPAPVNLAAIVPAFALPGRFQHGAPYGSGHINDTFFVVFDQAGISVRYLLRVFADVPAS